MTTPTPISAHDHGNCELCDQIERELAAAQEALRLAEERAEKNAALYSELIYAVASKWPNETRHQTALRYINQYESKLGEFSGRAAIERGR